ncbi:NAD(P)/FAD-dependent oxidoreductase [Sphingobium sp. EP60837]|uniref:NAD(P)/FAD-dependent oxidoreductase n=1 Tax=Sphingobium sp. EP60837 TaxID=1855519 RepID=UPI0007DCD531|nr:FAD-dependent monooxygenase [Sphingobium sp. EP60837]ANI79054.1 Putative oxidoreductase [Sphingobium sp. EP60837]
MAQSANISTLIIGGGPAGSAAAITLARAGMTPHLVERQSTPQNGVCGGFLGWDAIAALEELGIDPWSLGAHRITGFRLVSSSRCVEAVLPGIAAGVSRRTLDSALIEAAATAGAVVSRGRTARAVDPLTRNVRFDDGETLTAEALFLGVGKHELRGMARDFSVSSVGLRTTLPASSALHDALAHRVELHLFNDGYAGLLLQEDGSVNLCLSVSRARLAAAGNVPALLEQLKREAPLLAERLSSTPPAHFDAIAGVPYGWRAQASHHGIFRIGDQSAVIASLAGDGIAIALTSGTSAAKALLASGPEAAPAWQRKWRRECSRPVDVAETLRQGAAAPLTRSALMTLLHLAPRLGTGAAALTRVRKG